MRQILACDHSTNYWQSDYLVGHFDNFGSINLILWSSPQWEILLQQVLSRWKEAVIELLKRSEAESLLGRA